MPLLMVTPVLVAPAAELRRESGSERQGYRFRVWVAGRPTDVTTTSNSPSVANDGQLTFHAERTAGGKVFGTIASAFSGAYSGIASTAFVIDGDWSVKRLGYAATSAVGERVLLVPQSSGPWYTATPALIYDRGETTEIGSAADARFAPDGSVVGEFTADAQGRPLAAAMGDVLEVYARGFVWRKGVRTLRGFWQTDTSIPPSGHRPRPEPKGPITSAFPIPTVKSFATTPDEDPRLARVRKRGKGRFVLSVAGAATPFEFRGATAWPQTVAARSRKRFVYGTATALLAHDRTASVAFVKGASGFRSYPGDAATFERDGQVLLRAAPMVDPRAQIDTVATKILRGGRLRPIGLATDATIARDGAVKGYILVTADGKPFLRPRDRTTPRLFRQSFVWRNGVRRVTGTAPDPRG